MKTILNNSAMLRLVKVPIYNLTFDDEGPFCGTRIYPITFSLLGLFD